jgi:hypothetical protein
MHEIHTQLHRINQDFHCINLKDHCKFPQFLSDDLLCQQGRNFQDNQHQILYSNRVKNLLQNF